MKQKLMLLLLFLLAPALFLAEQGYTPTSFMVLGGRVEIMELTVSPTNLPQGAPIDISIVIRNDGTASTVASAEAAIYNSGNSLVANVTYGNVAIAPSQTVTITKTWDSGNTLPGLYRVVARVAYDGNHSDSVNVTFTIYAPVQPQPSGASYGILPYPIVIPPAIKPLKGEVGFVKNAVVKEVLTGQGAVESIILDNTGEKNLTINLLESGVPQGWITVQPATTIIIPGETRILHLQVTAPDDAIPGNYLVRLNATAEAASAADFVILRVKKYPENYSMPIATKTINVDAGSNKTTVSMDLMNPSKNATKTITLTEKVPPSFAGAPVAFLDKPGAISSEGGERFITWEFGELAPGEIVHFSYTIGGV
ncbi:MAG: NEW3 domain-containing protein, partial [Candidatus ainarchaeum sp.]|nr:NEW3 domain-containing protein [Candidatus ainarchaeum sp.]